MDVSSGHFELAGAGVGTGQAEHPMAASEELGNDVRADEAGGAGQEYAHGNLLCQERGIARRANMLN